MLSKWIDIERLIHSIKTAAACMIGILFAKLIGFPADQWIVITIIVVMCAQIYVGSVMQKAYLRFIGTLTGCLFATFIIVTVGGHDWAAAAAIGFASFFFSYLATGQENSSYTGTLGAVTVAIILMGPTPTTTFAAERFLEISAGLLIATLISQFFLPIHARTHLRRSQATTLTQLTELYQALMQPKTAETAQYDPSDLDEKIAKNLIKQRQLAKESVREPLGSAFDSQHFMQSLYCEREILRAMMFMHQARTHLDTSSIGFLTLPGLTEFNDMVIQALNNLKKSFETNKPLSISFHTPSLKRLKKEIQQAGPQSISDQRYIDGFIFTAEILAQSLTKLARLCQADICTETQRSK